MTEDIRVRRNKDLEKRSKNGTYVYAAIWAVIGVGTDFFKLAPVLFYTILLAFISLGLIRFLTYKYSSLLKNMSPKFWSTIIFFNALSPTFLLSMLFSASLVDPQFEPLFLFLLLSVFGVLSGGIVNFAPRPDVSFGYVVVTIIPPFIALSLLSNDRFMEAALLVLYGTYMFLLSRGLNEEYTLLTTQQIELERLNHQDSLTGIENRRSFDKSLSENWAQQSRSNGTISLMLIDIDHFKQINDSYGHSAGDHAIQSAANIIKSICRRVSDVVARIGGEEFAVLVSATNHETVVELAEQLRKAVLQSELKYEGAEVQFTISIGVATLAPQVSKKPSELFELADKRLYEAKKSGRNVVIAAGEELASLEPHE